MRKSTKLKIFRRKKRSVILSVLKRHSLRQHTNIENGHIQRIRPECITDLHPGLFCMHRIEVDILSFFVNCIPIPFWVR